MLTFLFVEGLIARTIGIVVKFYQDYSTGIIDDADPPDGDPQWRIVRDFDFGPLPARWNMIFRQHLPFVSWLDFRSMRLWQTWIVAGIVLAVFAPTAIAQSTRGTYSPPKLDRSVPRPPVEEISNDEGESYDQEEPSIVRVAHQTILVANQEPEKAAVENKTPAVVEPEAMEMPEPMPMEDMGSYYSGPETVYSGGASYCDDGGCSMGCDSCGDQACAPFPKLCNNQWFGSAEWLMWYRRGQNLPVLASETLAIPLFGGERLGEEGESGGRFSIGRWFDRQETQGIAFRFWGTNKENFGFSAPGNSPITIARPFNNNGVPAQQVIINPLLPDASEFLNIQLESEVYGGDVSLKRLWFRGLGGRVDLLYGYQYFRLNESLEIDSRAVLAAAEIPPNSSIDMGELFDIENEFHGGHLGISTHYGEGRWIVDGQFKLGLGSLKRSATLTATSVSEIPPAAPVTTQEGLLITATNRGATSESTFAVSPELNLNLGYRLNRNMDFTVGYTYLGMSDVLQVWRTIDTTVDGVTRPARNFSHDNYWVQGLNLGVTFNY